MWIGKAVRALLSEGDNERIQLRIALAQAVTQYERVLIENARFVEERKWMMQRLNHVERERGQLIQAAIGVKVAVPEFTPTYPDVGAMMDAMPDLTTIGGDAKEEASADPFAADLVIDYSQLPGYKRST